MKNEILNKIEEFGQGSIQHDKYFNYSDKLFDKITKILLNNSIHLENIKQNMATKEDMRKILNKLNVIIKILEKTNQKMISLRTIKSC